MKIKGVDIDILCDEIAQEYRELKHLQEFNDWIKTRHENGVTIEARYLSFLKNKKIKENGLEEINRAMPPDDHDHNKPWNWFPISYYFDSRYRSIRNEAFLGKPGSSQLSPIFLKLIDMKDDQPHYNKKEGDNTTLDIAA